MTLTSSLARGVARAARTWHREPVDERLELDGRSVRFTSVLDAETQRFEEDLHARRIIPCHEHVGQDGALTSEHGPIELPVFQRQMWLRQLGREFRLLQTRDAAGRPAMQIAVYVERPSFAPWIGQATAPHLGHATTGAEEQWALGVLRERCAAARDLMTLRLQPRRLGVHALCDFEARARHGGFRLSDPEAVTRTLLLELGVSDDELLATLSGKTRKKLRSQAGSGLEVRPLLDPRHASACRAASLSAVTRHGGDATRTPIATILALAAEEPTRVRALGLFREGQPDQVLAFAAAVRHGRDAEYVSAGSIDDPELRKHPFNYWMLWDLARWAREAGARHLDLGGISEGGPDDPLAGIAAFKRHFTSTEAEVGREMVAQLRPATELAARAVRALISH